MSEIDLADVRQKAVRLEAVIVNKLKSEKVRIIATAAAGVAAAVIISFYLGRRNGRRSNARNP